MRAIASVRPVLRPQFRAIRQTHHATVHQQQPAGTHMSAAPSRAQLGAVAVSAVGLAGWLGWNAAPGSHDGGTNSNDNGDSRSRISSRIQTTASKMEMNALGSSVDAINHSLGFILGHLDVHTPYQPRSRRSST